LALALRPLLLLPLLLLMSCAFRGRATPFLS
jgi:hypothetical protein